MAGKDRADRGRAHLVCDGLRQRDRKCGKIQPAACGTKISALYGDCAGRHAGKLHCHVPCTPKGAGPEHRGAGRACTSKGAGPAQGRAGISPAKREPLRPLYERPGKPGVLSLFCEGGCLPGNGRLHRLRQVRGAMSPEQRPSGKRKAGLGKNCTHCMACICYCPKEAIEYGKKSKGKPRYHFEALEKQQDV